METEHRFVAGEEVVSLDGDHEYKIIASTVSRKWWDGPETLVFTYHVEIIPDFCEDCDEEGHAAGDLVCPYTADSCSHCGGYHDSFHVHEDEEDREGAEDDEPEEYVDWQEDGYPEEI